MAAPSESPARIFAKEKSQPPPDLLAPPSPSLRFPRKSLVGRPSAFKPRRNFREGFANIPLGRGVTTYRSSFLRPSFPAPPGFVRLCVFRECIRSPGFWPPGEDSGRTAALPKASTMTVSPDARICGGLARMGPVARYDDSCESSSRATAPTATGGAPCFATSPIVSHSGRTRSPPTPPRRCAASNLTRGAYPNLPCAPRVGFFRIPLFGANSLTPARIPNSNPAKSPRRASFVRGARMGSFPPLARGNFVSANLQICFQDLMRSRGAWYAGRSRPSK